MACSVPSFLAAFTRASSPPKSAAEVAVAALLPSAVVEALSGAAPQALRASAATTASAPLSATVLGWDTVTPEGAQVTHEGENLSEQVGLSKAVRGIASVNCGEIFTADSLHNQRKARSPRGLVYAGHAV